MNAKSYVNWNLLLEDTLHQVIPLADAVSLISTILKPADRADFLRALRRKVEERLVTPATEKQQTSLESLMTELVEESQD